MVAIRSAAIRPIMAPMSCPGGASSRFRSSHRYGSMLRSGAASASDAAPAAPAASRAAPAVVVFWVSTPGVPERMNTP